jgi:hypothetical protein
MSIKMKTVCLSTILTLVMASGAVAIGFTTFVQAEIKEDLAEMKNQELVDREKITSLQISQAEINGKLSLILEKLESKK